MVVLGGGPRLPDDLRMIRDAFGLNVTRISVNRHGAIAVPCHFAVGVDFDFLRHMRAAACQLPAGLLPVNVGITRDCDVVIEGVPFSWSAVTAVDLALMLEPTGPVLLAGFDLYQGGGSVYWYGGADRPAAFGKSDVFTLQRQLDLWREWAAVRWSGRPIAAVGGPLVEIFGLGSFWGDPKHIRGGSADDARCGDFGGTPSDCHTG